MYLPSKFGLSSNSRPCNRSRPVPVPTESAFESSRLWIYIEETRAPFSDTGWMRSAIRWAFAQSTCAEYPLFSDVTAIDQHHSAYALTPVMLAFLYSEI